MNALRFGQRDRRALVIGVATIVGLLLIVRGVPALLSWRRDAEGLDDETRSTLEQARALIGRSDGVRDSTIARGRRMIALAPVILSGDTPNAAGATLAGILSGAAAQSALKMGAVQVHVDSLSHRAFSRVGARMDATGDIRGIMGMLTVLESGPTMLSIRSLSITQPELAAGDDRVEALRLEIEVEGIMLNPQPKRAK